MSAISIVLFSIEIIIMYIKFVFIVLISVSGRVKVFSQIRYPQEKKKARQTIILEQQYLIPTGGLKTKIVKKPGPGWMRKKPTSLQVPVSQVTSLRFE